MKEFKTSSDGRYIVTAMPFTEVYIPKDIYSDNIDRGGNPVAYAYGEGVRATGLFNIRFFTSPETDRSKVKLRTFNYPNTITMYPSHKVEMTLQLSPDMEEDKYVVLQFEEGDIMMMTEIQQNSKNCEAFMNHLIRGKLPKGLSYSDLFFAWMKNFEINGMDPGVPAITLQMIISENCRAKGDPMKQFRKVVNNKGVKLTDYEVHNMVDICSNNSVFNALTFERYPKMLTTSLNMTKDGVEQNETPLEQILYM